MYHQADLEVTVMATTMDTTAGWGVTQTQGEKTGSFEIFPTLFKIFFRPLSCYSASATSVITHDIAIEETLVTCDKESDVCFGKVE